MPPNVVRACVCVSCLSSYLRCVKHTKNVSSLLVYSAEVYNLEEWLLQFFKIGTVRTTDFTAVGNYNRLVFTLFPQLPPHVEPMCVSLSSTPVRKGPCPLFFVPRRSLCSMGSVQSDASSLSRSIARRRSD